MYTQESKPVSADALERAKAAALKRKPASGNPCAEVTVCSMTGLHYSADGKTCDYCGASVPKDLAEFSEGLNG